MKNAFFAAACALVLFSSCHKNIDGFDDFPNPLNSTIQVVEYHKTLYDSTFPAPYPAHFPYLFKKIYDPSGKIVTELDCSIEDDRGLYGFLYGYYHEFKVAQKGQMIYLINKALSKSIIPDTVARIKINEEGRPEYCSVNNELVNDLPFATSAMEHYVYKNYRLIAIKSGYTGDPFTQKAIDSLKYDQFGNILSFNNNSFQYDYSRKAKQQFYCEDFMGGGVQPFYVLEYLGFFPEVNSPTNIMIYKSNAVFQSALTNHQFDGQGRLISYDSQTGPTTITWK